MQAFTIQRDDAPNLTFTGTLLAGASTSPEQAAPDYSGSVGRWTELQLYRTEGGKYICQRIHRTQWQGETDSFTAAVCDDHAGVIEFFRHGRLAFEIYEAAAIPNAEQVA